VAVETNIRMSPPQKKQYVSPRGHTCVIIREDDQHIVVLYTDKDNPNHQWEWAMKRSHFEKNYKEVIRLGDAFKVQGTLTPVIEKDINNGKKTSISDH